MIQCESNNLYHAGGHGDKKGGKEEGNQTNKKTKYGYFRTDKPKEAGFSHEFISSDTAHLVKTTGATLDTLYGCEYKGVDTLCKALQRNVKLIPNHRWFGTKVGDKY